jgi:hypothetical protein
MHGSTRKNILEGQLFTGLYSVITWVLRSSSWRAAAPSPKRPTMVAQHSASQSTATTPPPQLIEIITSASDLITANNDYISLRSLCAPYSSSPFLSLNIARQLRYTIILAARRARRIHDDPCILVLKKHS